MVVADNYIIIACILCVMHHAENYCFLFNPHHNPVSGEDTEAERILAACSKDPSQDVNQKLSDSGDHMSKCHAPCLPVWPSGEDWSLTSERRCRVIWGRPQQSVQELMNHRKSTKENNVIKLDPVIFSVNR